MRNTHHPVDALEQLRPRAPFLGQQAVENRQYQTSWVIPGDVYRGPCDRRDAKTTPAPRVLRRDSRKASIQTAPRAARRVLAWGIHTDLPSRPAVRAPRDVVNKRCGFAADHCLRMLSRQRRPAPLPQVAGRMLGQQHAAKAGHCHAAANDPVNRHAALAGSREVTSELPLRFGHEPTWLGAADRRRPLDVSVDGRHGVHCCQVRRD